jgi:hypothetical protein
MNPEHGRLIANAFEELEHNPHSPEVKRAYEIFIEETLAQARQLQKEGIKFEPSGSNLYCVSHGISCGRGGNYETAQEMHKDIENNQHLFYRPSDEDYEGYEDHPLFQLTNIKNTNGHDMRANDVFRAVHDINGHNKADHAPFTPAGEQRAFVQHKKMYSNDAIRALFTETQGQGNWVNYNKKSGEQNRFYQKSGDLTKLKFPPQKAAIFPDGIVFADWHP